MEKFGIAIVIYLHTHYNELYISYETLSGILKIS